MTECWDWVLKNKHFTQAEKPAVPYSRVNIALAVHDRRQLDFADREHAQAVLSCRGELDLSPRVLGALLDCGSRYLLSSAMRARGETTVDRIHAQSVGDVTNRGSAFDSKLELDMLRRAPARAPAMGVITHKRALDKPAVLRPQKRRPVLTRDELLGAVRDFFSTSQPDPQEPAKDVDGFGPDVEELSTAEALGFCRCVYESSSVGAGQTRFPFVPRRAAQRSAALLTPPWPCTSSNGKARVEKPVSTDTEEEGEVPEHADNADVMFKALKSRGVCFSDAKGVSLST